MATSASGLVVGYASLVIGVSSCQRRHTTTGLGGPITDDIVLWIDVGSPVTGNTTPMMIVDSLVARATALTFGSNSPVTGPSASTTLVLGHRFWWFA